MSELAQVLDCDVNSVTVPGVTMLNGHPAKADPYIERLRLAVEFDGSYWHRASEKKDRAKTEAIKSQGVLVIRVREFPLGTLYEHDVVVSPRSSAFDQAVRVLTKVRELGSCHWLPLSPTSAVIEPSQRQPLMLRFSVSRRTEDRPFPDRTSLLTEWSVACAAPVRAIAPAGSAGSQSAGWTAR